MQDDDDGADETGRAAYFAQCAELFIEKVRAEDRALASSVQESVDQASVLTDPISTLRAPRGVTKMAGAKA